MILLLHIAITCLLLTFADNTNVNAIRCHECIPERVNNYCTDYKDGYPTAARQINCQKYCFKADGTFKVDYGIEKDRSKKFVVSACVDQSTADALEIGNVDKCQTGDRAERLLGPLIAQNEIRPQSQSQQQQQQQYNQQQQRNNNNNQYGQQNMQQQLSFHLPGQLDDARYCRCETDLCNGTAQKKTVLTLTVFLAIFTAVIGFKFS